MNKYKVLVSRWVPRSDTHDEIHKEFIIEADNADVVMKENSAVLVLTVTDQGTPRLVAAFNDWEMIEEIKG